MKSIKLLIAGLLSLLPTLAMAQGAEGQSMGVMGQVIFFAGFILIFYFLIWRPQSKRAKEHKNLMSSLNKGDEVVTSGGMVGRITKVSDDFIVLEVADNIEIREEKQKVNSRKAKSTMPE